MFGKPLIEATIKEVAKRMRMTAEKLKEKDRRWEMIRERAPAAELLVRRYGYRVTEMVRCLRHDHAYVSLMLSRLTAGAETKIKDRNVMFVS